MENLRRNRETERKGCGMYKSTVNIQVVASRYSWRTMEKAIQALMEVQGSYEYRKAINAQL